MTTPDPTIPQFSTQLWSECVGLALGDDPDQPTVVYEFSNGRKFARRYPYDPPVPEPEPTP